MLVCGIFLRSLIYKSRCGNCSGFRINDKADANSFVIESELVLEIIEVTVKKGHDRLVRSSVLWLFALITSIVEVLKEDMSGYIEVYFESVVSARNAVGLEDGTICFGIMRGGTASNAIKD